VFAGTSRTYESEGPYSSLNLKCKNIAGIQFGFSNSIVKSNWILFGGFEKKWLVYEGTIFQNGYDPEIGKNKKH
jgi:hypothetical protein